MTAPLFALSTASVYPESTAHAFGYAGRLGYDALEVMVGIDELSQSVESVQHLVDYHQLPVCAVHAPCLLITQRVWGTDPWGKLERSAEMATDPRAPTWWSCTRRSAGSATTRPGSSRASPTWSVVRASRSRSRTCTRGGPRRAARCRSTCPGWDPSEETYANTTIDLSHAATAQSDPLAMAERLGDRLRHLHLDRRQRIAQGRAPGPGPRQPAGRRAPRAPGHDRVRPATSWSRSTPARPAAARQREADLRESLAFGRLHFARVAP